MDERDQIEERRLDRLAQIAAGVAAGLGRPDGIAAEQEDRFAARVSRIAKLVYDKLDF